MSPSLFLLLYSKYEIGREELLKRYLVEKYMKIGELSKDEETFCEQIDWHPVDELPIKP